MAQETGKSESKNCFIGYNRHDRAWSEWIAQQMEQAGYSTIIQAWNFASGRNFRLQDARALCTITRTVLVLSPYLLD